MDLLSSLNNSHFLLKASFNTKERLEFYRILAFFTEDKNTALEAVEEMAKTSAKQKKTVANMYRLWEREMRNGAPLSEAMNGWASQSEVGFITVGEDSGNLIGPLNELIAILEMRMKVREENMKMMFTPMMQLLVLVGAIYGISSGIVPQITRSVPIDKAPSYALHFFAFCAWFANWGLLIFGGLLASIVLAVATSPFLVGPIRDALDRVWPYTWIRVVAGSMFLITLSGMFRSQISIKQAVENLSTYANPWTKHHLKKMLRNVSDGLTEGQSVNTGLLPDDMAGEVERYSEKSGFAKAFQRIGELHLKRHNGRVQLLVGTIGTSTMFGLFLMIILFLLSLYGVIKPLMNAARPGGF